MPQRKKNHRCNHADGDGSRDSKKVCVEEKFEFGDLVWAKMKSYPPWPAMVMKPKKPPYEKDGHYQVYFYGTKNYAWVPTVHIHRNSQTMLSQYMNRKKKSKGLREAFKEMMEAAEDPAINAVSSKNSVKKTEDRDKPSTSRQEEPEVKLYWDPRDKMYHPMKDFTAQWQSNQCQVLILRNCDPITDTPSISSRHSAWKDEEEPKVIVVYLDGHRNITGSSDDVISADIICPESVAEEVVETMGNETSDSESSSAPNSPSDASLISPENDWKVFTDEEKQHSMEKYRRMECYPSTKEKSISEKLKDHVSREYEEAGNADLLMNVPIEANLNEEEKKKRNEEEVLLRRFEEYKENSDYEKIEDPEIPFYDLVTSDEDANLNEEEKKRNEELLRKFEEFEEKEQKRRIKRRKIKKRSSGPQFTTRKEHHLQKGKERLIKKRGSATQSTTKKETEKKQRQIILYQVLQEGSTQTPSSSLHFFSQNEKIDLRESPGDGYVYVLIPVPSQEKDDLSDHQRSSPRRRNVSPPQQRTAASGRQGQSSRQVQDDASDDQHSSPTRRDSPCPQQRSCSSVRQVHESEDEDMEVLTSQEPPLITEVNDKRCYGM